MYTITIRIPLKVEKRPIWDDMLKSSDGLDLARRQKGFISAECGYTTDGVGNLVWHSWEKWETKEDFFNYNAVAERQEGSRFIRTSLAIMSGTAELFWLEDVVSY